LKWRCNFPFIDSFFSHGSEKLCYGHGFFHIHCLALFEFVALVDSYERAAHDGSSALVVLVDSEDGPSDLNDASPCLMLFPFDTIQATSLT